MCTAILSFDPESPVPVLLVGVRDELFDRPWQPPAAHWPDRPRLIGGRDLQAGGTWLAVDPVTPRVSCVLNALGPAVPEEGRRSRGELPLRVAADGKPGELDLTHTDPFHLLGAEPAAVRLWSWDGAELTERTLGPGLHLVVNSGLEGGDRTAAGEPAGAEAVEFMTARVAHFRRRLAAAARPAPGDGHPARAWGEWLPLVDGDGLTRDDPRSLLPRREFDDGRVWGTTSVSLVALTAPGQVRADAQVRYDFSATPGDPRAWTRVG